MQWSHQQSELVVLNLSIYNKLRLFNTHVLMHDDLHSAGQHSTKWRSDPKPMRPVWTALLWQTLCNPSLFQSQSWNPPVLTFPTIVEILSHTYPFFCDHNLILKLISPLPMRLSVCACMRACKCACMRVCMYTFMCLKIKWHKVPCPCSLSRCCFPLWSA